MISRIACLNIFESLAHDSRGFKGIICSYNLTGLDNAIDVVFTDAEIKNCIVHLLCILIKYVSYKDFKKRKLNITDNIRISIPLQSQSLYNRRKM